jgi:hypothetical protein
LGRYQQQGREYKHFFHFVKFTSPSPSTQLYVDIGHKSPNWILHIMSSGIGLGYGTSTINDNYHYATQVTVSGELQQGPNANACANTNFMTFAMWAPWSTYQPLVCRSPNRNRPRRSRL